MRGWSTEPVVRETLDRFSRLQGGRLLALEGVPADDMALVDSRVGVLREIIVRNVPVGWIALDGGARSVVEVPGAAVPGAATPGGQEALLDLAAFVIAGQVADLDDLGSLSGEIADIYEELGLLYSLSDSLGAMHDETAICDAVLDQAQRVIGGERGSILLVNEESRLLTPVARRNISEPAGRETPIHAGEGISGYVLATGRAIIIETLDRIPESVERNDSGLPADYHLVRPPLLSAPMRARGISVGVVNLSMKSDGKPFTSHDLKLAQALASEAAVFIE
ncbi:MAG TPA: GAF domain-containing protein, partial [Patescibacteria group bacterium]|nr:GAF domain-containing protein [Patescibacteria group bacterium]